MGAILSVLITAGLGTWLAYVWQQRSAKDSRYFEASRTQYDLMRDAARNLAKLAGERFYATHRLCRISPKNDYFDEAKEDFRQSVLTWNRNHLQMDLDVRTLFANASVVEFARLQTELAALTNRVSRRLESVKAGEPPVYDIIRDVEVLRGRFFYFCRE